MNDEVIRANPVQRKRAVVILLGAAALGAIGIRRGLPWLERLRQAGAQRTICISFAAVIVGLAIAVIASGRRIARLGRRTMELQEFPPPGIKLLHDVRRTTGARAVLLGRGYVVIGWTLVTLAVALLCLGSYVLVLLWPR